MTSMRLAFSFAQAIQPNIADGAWMQHCTHKTQQSINIQGYSTGMLYAL